MTIRSTAKINLFLDITGRDPTDGYHFLDSLFQEIDLSDTIRIRRTLSGRDCVRFVSGPSGPDVSGLAGSDTTVHKALRLFKQEFGVRQGFSVTVRKTIPLGAGLGGGSSNAAFTLLGLARMSGIPGRDLEGIGRRIGSDVPFFFQGGLCRVRGKGEIVERIPGRLKGVVFLVVYPGIPVSTRWAYSLITDYQARKKAAPEPNKTFFDIDFLSQILYNKFERSVLSNSRELSDAKAILDRTLRARVSFMSGSGSSLVYVYGDRKTALADQKAVRKGLTYPAFLCSPVYRD